MMAANNSYRYGIVEKCVTLTSISLTYEKLYLSSDEQKKDFVSEMVFTDADQARSMEIAIAAVFPETNVV